jgi:hypothetical protein
LNRYHNSIHDDVDKVYVEDDDENDVDDDDDDDKDNQ